MTDLHPRAVAEVDRLFAGRFGLETAEAALREVLARHEPWDVDRDDWRCTTCRDCHAGTAASAPCVELRAVARALGIKEAKS